MSKLEQFHSSRGLGDWPGAAFLDGKPASTLVTSTEGGVKWL